MEKSTTFRCSLQKNILTIRGSFRPVTKVNIDMMENGYNAFIKENKVDKENVQLLFEITLSNLKMEGDIDEKDFLDRADILCSLRSYCTNFQL